MRRVLSCVLVVGSFSAQAADQECKVATNGDSPVAIACKEGGRDAAKRKMKELVNAAKKGGQEFKCGGCHVDTKKFELKENAPDDFKKLLSAAGVQ